MLIVVTYKALMPLLVFYKRNFKEETETCNNRASKSSVFVEGKYVGLSIEAKIHYLWL